MQKALDAYSKAIALSQKKLIAKRCLYQNRSFVYESLKQIDKAIADESKKGQTATKKLRSQLSYSPC